MFEFKVSTKLQFMIDRQQISHLSRICTTASLPPLRRTKTVTRRLRESPLGKAQHAESDATLTVFYDAPTGYDFADFMIKVSQGGYLMEAAKASTGQ
jgi:hypothetical protein